MNENTNNNNNSNGNKPKINVPRPNLTWLYVLIALVFAWLWFTSDGGSATKEVNYTEFQDMVTQGYADKIVAYENNTMAVYIKPEHIVNVFHKAADKVGRIPDVPRQLGSLYTFYKYI